MPKPKTPRPYTPPTGMRTQKVNVYMDPKQIKAGKKLAARLGVTFAELLRTALEEKLEKEADA